MVRPCWRVQCDGEQPLTLIRVRPGATPGKHIVTVSEDGSLILWDPKTANRVFRMSISTRPFVVTVAARCALGLTGRLFRTVIHLLCAAPACS